jgi:multimeric flavodoxin WrbA
MMVRVAVVFHSGYGHTGRQAKAVAEGAGRVPGTEVNLIALGTDLTAQQWQTLDKADAMIFGSPTYMSSSSAAFRAFAEATSPVWNDNLRWRDKIAGGFTNSGNKSGDKLQTLVEMALFAAQHGMIWVGYLGYGGWNTSNGSLDDLNRLGSWLGAMAQSNMDEGPDDAPSDSDLRTAALLGQRIAEVTHLHVCGRLAAAASAVDQEVVLADAGSN